MPSKEEVEQKQKEIKETLADGEELDEQDIFFYLCQQNLEKAQNNAFHDTEILELFFKTQDQ